jgi:hypothetical protein
MPWYEYSPDAAGFTKPLVEVRLWHGAASQRLVALVDSGADSSLLDVQYAELLGLDRADAHVTVSVVASGDEIEVLHWPTTPLELQFGNDRFPFDGAFIDFGTGDGENLMGRKDFFQRYVIQFWDAAELMNIDTSPDYPLSATAQRP